MHVDAFFGVVLEAQVAMLPKFKPLIDGDINTPVDDDELDRCLIYDASADEWLYASLPRHFDVLADYIGQSASIEVFRHFNPLYRDKWPAWLPRRLALGIVDSKKSNILAFLETVLDEADMDTELFIGYIVDAAIMNANVGILDIFFANLPRGVDGQYPIKLSCLGHTLLPDLRTSLLSQKMSPENFLKALSYFEGKEIQFDYVRLFPMVIAQFMNIEVFEYFEKKVAPRPIDTLLDVSSYFNVTFDSFFPCSAKHFNFFVYLAKRFPEVMKKLPVDTFLKYLFEREDCVGYVRLRIIPNLLPFTDFLTEFAKLGAVTVDPSLFSLLVLADSTDHPDGSPPPADTNFAPFLTLLVRYGFLDPSLTAHDFANFLFRNTVSFEQSFECLKLYVEKNPQAVLNLASLLDTFMCLSLTEILIIMDFLGDISIDHANASAAIKSFLSTHFAPSHEGVGQFQSVVTRLVEKLSPPINIAEILYRVSDPVLSDWLLSRQGLFTMDESSYERLIADRLGSPRGLASDDIIFKISLLRKANVPVPNDLIARFLRSIHSLERIKADGDEETFAVNLIAFHFLVLFLGSFCCFSMML